MTARLVSLICLIGVLIPATLARSEEEFICTFGSDNRMVSVVKTDAAHAPNTCRVDYTRDGRTTTLWSSKAGYAFCVARAASLVTKLAQGHFSCEPQSVETPDDRT